MVQHWYTRLDIPPFYQSYLKSQTSHIRLKISVKYNIFVLTAAFIKNNHTDFDQILIKELNKC